LIKRLDGYYKMEGFNAIWIAAFVLFINIKNGFENHFLLNYGIGVMVFILIQGTHYWRLKLHVLQKKEVDHLKELSRFKKCKTVNEFLIILIPIFFFIQWWINGQQFIPENHLGWTLFVNFFAIAEHINYYYVQLSYDNAHDWKYLWRNKRLKIASLKKDIRDQSL